MIKVSIIVPIYNVEIYLQECLDSLIHQSLSEIEIICINDGSTDSSPIILQRYAARDSRIRIISQRNSGYGKAMNQGFDAAVGEYIGIVEPDDYVDLHMFQDLYETAQLHNLDFIKADFLRFTKAADGSKRLEYVPLDYSGRYYNQVFNPSQTPAAIRITMNTWCGIYKRIILRILIQVNEKSFTCIFFVKTKPFSKKIKSQFWNLVQKIKFFIYKFHPV